MPEAPKTFSVTCSNPEESEPGTFQATYGSEVVDGDVWIQTEFRYLKGGGSGPPWVMTLRTMPTANGNRNVISDLIRDLQATRKLASRLTGHRWRITHRISYELCCIFMCRPLSHDKKVWPGLFIISHGLWVDPEGRYPESFTLRFDDDGEFDKFVGHLKVFNRFLYRARSEEFELRRDKYFAEREPE